MEAALELLEALPPGNELVCAYTFHAAHLLLNSAFPEAITAADQALRLADGLGLPQPAAAVGFRGFARASLGEQHGVEEMREALTFAIEQGEGRSAAVIYNNLALITWLYQGSLAALALIEEGIAFSHRRDLVNLAEAMTSGKAPHLAETGRTDEALGEATGSADRLEAAGDINFVMVRSLQLRVLTEQGNHERAPDPAPMLETARNSGLPADMAMAVAAGAQLLQAGGKHHQGHALITELDQLEGTRADPR